MKVAVAQMPSQRQYTYPIGDNFSLYDQPVRTSGTTRSGVTSVCGFPLEFHVDDTEDVLFPTDFGLSLMRTARDAGLACSGRVLDVGCGAGNFVCGFAQLGAEKTVGLDIWGPCLDSTRRNCERNGVPSAAVELINVSVEDYQPDERYDLVVSNPPHLPDVFESGDQHGVDIAALGGEDGRSLYDSILTRIDDLVAPGGYLILAHSSLANVPCTLRRLESRGYKCGVIQSHFMDLPLLRYEANAYQLFARLNELKSIGAAEICGTRFWVRIIVAQRRSDR